MKRVFLFFEFQIIILFHPINLIIMVRILKTVDWEDCKDVLLHFSEKRLIKPVNGAQPCNFCEFLMNYPLILHPDMMLQLKKWLMSEPFNDVTNEVVAAEDASLFSQDDEGDGTHALGIALTGLCNNNTWHYLDCNHLMVVRFMHLAGVANAQLFCAAEKCRSVAHLVEIRGNLTLVPVLFVNDITPYYLLANTKKLPYLREYLPRVTGDLLSKKRHRAPDEAPVSAFAGSGIDKGDML